MKHKTLHPFFFLFVFIHLAISNNLAHELFSDGHELFPDDNESVLSS
jgi:hypothetical protein